MNETKRETYAVKAVLAGPNGTLVEVGEAREDVTFGNGYFLQIRLIPAGWNGDLFLCLHRGDPAPKK